VATCPHCTQPLDDNNLLKCPHCNIDIPTYIRANLENLKKSQDYLEGYKQRIDREVALKVKAQIWKYAAALAVFCVGGLTLVYLANRLLTQRLLSAGFNRQLQQPYLKEAMVNAAKDKTEEVIRKEIAPQIESAKASAAGEFNAFKSFLENKKAQLGEEYDTLVRQASILKARNRLAQLANAAIADGSREALEELESALDNPAKADLAEVAAAEMARVKAFYATDARIKNESVPYTSSAGIVIVDDKIPTATLLADLTQNPDWRVRAKFAELLGNRRESGVADALLEAAKLDKNLNVVKAALEGFCRVTGFKSADIFDYAAAERWWQQNKK
jgi:hypothetical protein